MEIRTYIHILSSSMLSSYVWCYARYEYIYNPELCVVWVEFVCVFCKLGEGSLGLEGWDFNAPEDGCITRNMSS